MYLHSVVTVARNLNYLYFLLLFSAWPGLYSSSCFPAPLLVHGCHTPSSYTDTVACSHSKGTTVFLRLSNERPITVLASFFCFCIVCVWWVAELWLYSQQCFQLFLSKSGNTSVIQFFLFMWLFQLLSPNQMLILAACGTGQYWQ